MRIIVVDSNRQPGNQSWRNDAGDAEPTRVKRQTSPPTFGHVVKTYLETAEATPHYDILPGASPSKFVPFIAFASLCLKNTRTPLNPHPAWAASMKGSILHMSKILEGGGVCAAPKCPGAVGTLYNDGSFDICPVSPKSWCPSISVATCILQFASTLFIPELGGKLDLTQASYKQLQDDRTVKVQNSGVVFPDSQIAVSQATSPW